MAVLTRTVHIGTKSASLGLILTTSKYSLATRDIHSASVTHLFPLFADVFHHLISSQTSFSTSSVHTLAKKIHTIHSFLLFVLELMEYVLHAQYVWMSCIIVSSNSYF
jgi:hypothetical protein